MEAANEIAYADVVDETGWIPVTPSDLRIREYMGSPRQVIDILDGHEVLVVQGAPVTDGVLDADPALAAHLLRARRPRERRRCRGDRPRHPGRDDARQERRRVAELTIAFLIMLARRLPEVLALRRGRRRVRARQLRGRQLVRPRSGRQGPRTRRIRPGRSARGRAGEGVRHAVVVSDPFVEPSAVRAEGVEPADLERLLGTADFVSLHARATADNARLIGPPELARMKAGACLVNTARDSLIDEDAVLSMLRSGRLAGLAVDLVSPSPATGRHPLLGHPNVIITTHIGGATYETLERAGGEWLPPRSSDTFGVSRCTTSRTPRRSDRPGGSRSGDDPPARDRPRDRQLPGRPLRRRWQASLDRPARVVACGVA